MSLFHGTSVIKRGLSYYLDAANVKSYPGTGTFWQDISGNGKKATLLNGPTFSPENNGTIVFDGTNDNAYSFSALDGSFASFSVMVWFNTPSVADFRNVIDCNFTQYASGNIGPRLEMSTAGNLGWVYSNQTSVVGSHYGHTVVNSGLQANVWHCAAITYNGGTNTSTTYYNGNSTGISRVVNGTPSGFVGVFNGIGIGTGFTGVTQRLFQGRIPIVLLYNVELTATEIIQNFNAHRGRYGI